MTIMLVNNSSVTLQEFTTLECRDYFYHCLLLTHATKKANLLYYVTKDIIINSCQSMIGIFQTGNEILSNLDILFTVFLCLIKF